MTSTITWTNSTSRHLYLENEKCKWPKHPNHSWNPRGQYGNLAYSLSINSKTRVFRLHSRFKARTPKRAQLQNLLVLAFPPSLSSAISSGILIFFSILPLLNLVCEVRFYFFLNCFVLNIFVVERVFSYFVDLLVVLYL